MIAERYTEYVDNDVDVDDVDDDEEGAGAYFFLVRHSDGHTNRHNDGHTTGIPCGVIGPGHKCDQSQNHDRALPGQSETTMKQMRRK